MMLDSSRHDSNKWDRGGGGSRDGRERDRQRAANARAQQTAVQQAAQQNKPDANCLFRAPIRISNSNDRISQQIQSKMGDYSVAQSLLDNPGDSIGVYTEPPSPAPCISRGGGHTEFKKPHYGSSMSNGRHPHPGQPPPYHRSSSSSFNKPSSSETAVASSGPPVSAATTAHARPPPTRMPNGTHQQNIIDTSGQPPIEKIFKEMQVPIFLSEIAATPRKEVDNKFIYNDLLNKVQKNPDWSSANDVRPAPAPQIARPILNVDNRVSTTRQSSSPDLLEKDLVHSESEDEPVPGLGLSKPLSPLSTPTTSPSDSSQSDSESDSSHETAPAPAAVPTAPEATTAAAAAAPTAIVNWGLRNFAPQPLQTEPQISADADAAAAAIAELKRIPQSPVSSLSGSSVDAVSPGTTTVRGTKRGRPRKDEVRPRKVARHDSTRKPRGRPRKQQVQAATRGSSRSASCESDAEPRVHTAQATTQNKNNILGRVFKPNKPEDGGLGKGGAKGGKGGKGKAQVIVEASAPESGADDDHERRLRDERRRLESPRRNTSLSESSINKSSDFESPRRPIVAVEEEHERRLRDERRRLESPRRNTSLSESSLNKSSDFESPRRPIVPESPKRPKSELQRHKIEEQSPRRSKPDLLSPKRHRKELQSPVNRPRLEVESPRRTTLLPQTSPKNIKSDIGRIKCETTRIKDEPASPQRESESPSRVKLETTSPPRTRLEIESPRVSQAKAVSNEWPRPRSRWRLPVKIPLFRLRPETAARISGVPPPPAPIYFSYLTSPPPEAMHVRDHTHYLEQATRLRARAEAEQGPLARVVLYLESVLCVVMTGRVLEKEFDTKKAFTLYRETIEYIKSIHSMPSRYRASPHSTFIKLDILSLRVQALLYLRMFKMYKLEMKEYDRLVNEYEQMSPTPDPEPVPSGGGSGSSSGYSSYHSVPVPTHTALMQLTKYYRFLHVAHDLWEKADHLCRLRSNIELFQTVDQVVGQLTLFSSFRHLVTYVTYAISIIKNESNE